MLTLSFVALFAAGCDGSSRAPLQDALKKLSACARLEVVVEPVAKDGISKYSITDKAVIEELAKTIDPRLPTSVARGKYGTATYVSIKAFAKEGEAKPAVTFTIVDAQKLIFNLQETTFEAKLPDKELNRRLRKQDFEFPEKENREAPTPRP